MTEINIKMSYEENGIREEDIGVKFATYSGQAPTEEVVKHLFDMIMSEVIIIWPEKTNML